MRDFAVPVAFAVLLSLGTGLAHAAESIVSPSQAASGVPPDSARTVYMQRDANGNTVFTDRPAAGLVTERRWAIEPEDAQAAAARREAGRAQSERVTERIQRSIDQQQQRFNELQIEQARAQGAADALRAQRLREREWQDEPRYVLLPPYARGFGHGGPHRPGARPPRPPPPTPPAPLLRSLAPPVESR